MERCGGAVVADALKEGGRVTHCNQSSFYHNPHSCIVQAVILHLVVWFALRIETNSSEAVVVAVIVRMEEDYAL
jgi:hypothetical protein